jgi:tRNA A37 methylthiotransferase MiaB
VLVDGPTRLNAAALKGRTTCNRIVHFEEGATEVQPGDFLEVRITRAHAHSLSGVVEARGDAA